MVKRLLFVVNVDWFFLSHRLPIAKKAIEDGYSVHIATTLTRSCAELERHGLVVHPLFMDRSKTSVLDAITLVIRLLHLYRHVQPDIVHLVTIKPLLIGGVAARLARIPALVSAVSGMGHVFTAHGASAQLRRLLVGILYRLALKHSNQRVIFQNEDDLKSIGRFARLSAARICLIRGSGVDLTRFACSAVPAGGPIVVMAARLLVDKGVNEFIAAAGILKPDFPNARFVLVGDIDYGNPGSLDREDLQFKVRQGHVEWWGHRTDIENVYAQSFVVVLPSYREGLPKALLEAAACGRAIVTTDVPGCRDAICNEVTGLLVPVRDPEALARAIRTLLQDPAKCQAMGAAGRKLAESAFDVRQVVDAHLAIYRDILCTAGNATGKTMT